MMVLFTDASMETRDSEKNVIESGIWHRGLLFL